MQILIIDDHALLRAGLRKFCADIGAAVLEAGEGATALKIQMRERPELTILDLNMTGFNGFDLLHQLLVADPAAKVLIFSMHCEPAYATQAMDSGAKGFLSKSASPEELQVALSRILSGATYIEKEIARRLAVSPGEKQLNERDLEILRQLGEGRSLSEIAQQLGVSYKTVANAAAVIKGKLGVTRTADLIRLSVLMATHP